MTTKTKETTLYGDIPELIRKAEEGYKGKITKIIESTSNQFFNNELYEDRKGYVVEVQLEETNGEFTEWFTYPKEIGVLLSKIYAFKKKYGKLPEKNMVVDCVYTDGNWRIKL